MNTALHAIADRVAAMPVPPRANRSETIIPLRASHEDGYAEGHADAIRRVVKMLRWLAEGDEADMTAWVWVRNIVIPDSARKTLHALHRAGVTPDFFAMPDIQGTAHGTLYVPVPRWFAKEHRLALLDARPEEAFDPPLRARA